ncbi:MAG: response regulator, partial [Desulfobacterales bacterium]|nr:response regulator [Desulfobacterales bacterium]
MTTSILLVDDHPVFLKGLRSLLDDEADMNVIGMAGDGRQAFEIIRDLRPEVVVMDISMPGINGIEATKQIVSQFPETKVIALSIHSEKEFVENMLKAGAIGYIVKESVPEELVKGIRCVMEGKSYLSPAITGLILSRFRNSLFEEAAACPADFEIIESKLKPEKITEYYICRQRLLNILNDKRHLPLFTITAPAGYGKTTLAASWIADIDWPCVWLSLDKSDNDLHRFLGYLVHSIRAIFPDALERFSIAVASNPLPPIQPIAAKLLNDINQLNTNFLIVLDNFHHIRDKRINDFLNELFRYPPKSMHWLLVGRSDPFLSLSKFRAKGQLGEIRLNELRFTQAEASLFLTRLVNGPVDTEWVYQVTKRTEGWVTGLLLSALARGDGKNVRQVMSKMGPHREFVMDYLFHEVFDSRSDPMKQGLLIASVLNSFNRAVCEALFENFCGDDDQQPMSGKDFVERIRKENLFVVSQYKEGEWFRFHLEFQHFLQNQLRYEKGPEAIPKLHSLAFTWFRDSGHTDQAIFHAVAAGQISDAEDLIENNRWDVLDSDRRDQLRKWVELLPEGANNNRAGILLTKAWNLLMSLRITEILPTIRQVEALSNKIESQKYRISEILFFKGVV